MWTDTNHTLIVLPPLCVSFAIVLPPVVGQGTVLVVGREVLVIYQEDLACSVACEFWTCHTYIYIVDHGGLCAAL